MKSRHPFVWLSESGQKWAFIVALVVAVLVMATLQVLGGPLKTAAAPAGIVSYELARDLAAARGILASWGPQGQVYAGLNLGLDYLFMVAYAATIGLGCVLVTRRLGRWSGGLATVGIGLAWAQWAAALLDATENYALIRLLLGSQNPLWPPLAYGCALPKFLIVGVGILFVVLGGLGSAVARSG